MTIEEQNLAIAEVCGWKFHEGQPIWIHGRPPPMNCHLGPPDFIRDLNAMHEAEVILKTEQCATYAKELCELLDRDQEGSSPATDADAAYHLIHATAAQRAEAFLRTLGLWKGDNDFSPSDPTLTSLDGRRKRVALG